jgi:hypothetical protein
MEDLLNSEETVYLFIEERNDVFQIKDQKDYKTEQEKIKSGVKHLKKLKKINIGKCSKVLKRRSFIVVFMILIFSCGNKKEDARNINDQSGNKPEVIKGNDKKYEFTPREINFVKQLIDYYSSRGWESSVMDVWEAYDSQKKYYLDVITNNDSINIDKTQLQGRLDSLLLLKKQYEFEKVKEYYSEYNTLEGRSFAFLMRLEDSGTIALIKDFKTNPKVDSIEYKRIRSNFPKYFD